VAVLSIGVVRTVSPTTDNYGRAGERLREEQRAVMSACAKNIER